MKLIDLLQAPDLAAEFERLQQGLGAGGIAVTGVHGGEGVTTVAAGLAKALAGRAPVLLAEGNLRRPVLARALAIAGPGLREWDLDGALPLHAWQAVPRASVLTAGVGRGADDAAAVSRRLAAAAQRAQREFECVVWDTPPLTQSPDLLALAPWLTGVIVVAEMDHSRVDALHFIRSALERARLPVIGCLLNRAGRYWPRAVGRRAVG